MKLVGGDLCKKITKVFFWKIILFIYIKFWHFSFIE